MKPLELTAEEAEVLRDVLRRRIAEMEIEVSHTHAREFRAMLKHRQQVMESALAKLAAEG
jgi:hypothetical protein